MPPLIEVKHLLAEVQSFTISPAPYFVSCYMYNWSERDEDEKEIESKKNSSLKIKEVECRKEKKMCMM